MDSSIARSFKRYLASRVPSQTIKLAAVMGVSTASHLSNGYTFPGTSFSTSILPFAAVTTVSQDFSIPDVKLDQMIRSPWHS